MTVRDVFQIVTTGWCARLWLRIQLRQDLRLVLRLIGVYVNIGIAWQWYASVAWWDQGWHWLVGCNRCGYS